jgi:rifampicin phosphotransferase
MATRDINVPPDHQCEFTELLTEARDAYGTREDNVGVTLSWPLGLLRRALLEAGQRLQRAGGIDDARHVFELTAQETADLLRGASTLSASDVAARAELRKQVDGVEPPPYLGPPPTAPPNFDIFPAAMAKLAKATMAMASRLGAARDQAPMTGTGIGTSPHRGRACVAADPGEALTRLEPGDVLITSITTPACNALLPLVGAIVTEQGGMLSHPAIVARELGIVAVVGAPGVLDIPDGSWVEVDPHAGTVKVVDR